MDDRRTPGIAATGPTEIPKRGWWEILMRVKTEISQDHVSVVAAGVAFFGLLAIFPAIGAVISLAGYLLDPEDVARQIDRVLTLLPPNAAAIIQDQIVKVTGGDETATGFAAIIALALALYGAMSGMKTLIEGMNVAYDEDEKRGFFALNVTALLLTLALILGLILSFCVMMVIPAALAFLPLPSWLETAIAWLQWPVLAVLTIVGLSILYRFGPSRAHAKWQWISVGSVAATALWLAGTVAFSIYAQNFGSYNETYGTLAGVIILLTWLWLSAFIILAGAELNAETEHQTAQDSTTGPERPMGRRGATMADTLPDGTTPGAVPAAERAPAPRPPETAGSRLLSAGALALLAAWRARRRR